MKTIAPLTKVQYGLYVECVAHQGEACYNLPYLYVLDGSLDEEKLRHAIEVAVKAHPTLFTRMELDEQGDPDKYLKGAGVIGKNLALLPFTNALEWAAVTGGIKGAAGKAGESIVTRVAKRRIALLAPRACPP